MARTTRQRPAKPRFLYEVSVAIDPELEPALRDRLAALTPSVPSIYTDWSTQETRLSVFLDNRREAIRLTSVIQDRGRDIRLCGAEARIRRIRNQDWAEAWKHHFPLLRIDRTLVIRPPWIRVPSRRGLSVVTLEPGLTFGTGHHATTRFCLQQIVRARDARQEQSMLDIGTGSGILAIAAAKLGFRPVRAFDIDSDAIRIARSNAARNATHRRIRFSIQDLAALPANPRVRFDVVCANLTSDLLRAHAGLILAHLNPRGLLILAGILHHQSPSVLRCYSELSGADRDQWTQKRIGEWHSAALRLAG